MTAPAPKPAGDGWSPRAWRWILLGVGMLVGLAGLARTLDWFGWGAPPPASGDANNGPTANNQADDVKAGVESAAPTSPGEAIAVDTVHPKSAPPGFAQIDTQPAYLQGFFTANLMSRVAGPVKSIQKNIGDSVSAGEVVIALDVPDLVADLAQKVASVKQAEHDEQAAVAAASVAAASLKVAESLARQRAAEEAHASAEKEFHDDEFARYKILAQRDAVVATILDEKRRDMEAAAADLKSAQIATQTAQAEATEFSAKLAAANVDVEVKKSKIAVAQAERDQAQAMVDFSQIKAPFNGTVVARLVDPGSFVQNASTGNPTPLLRIVKTDVVTAVVWIPEKDTPYISKNTDINLRFDALGERRFTGKVTRFSPWLDPDKGRDMRVEVDIDNRDGLLTPGMYGDMTLVLRRFDGAMLVPVGAVSTSNNRTFICEVRGGRAVRVPVRVQFENGVLAKIVKLAPRTNPATGVTEDIPRELTGQEQIVRSGQGELTDGQPVRAVASDW